MSEEQAFYRVEEAARHLGISRSLVVILIGKGVIPSVKLGGRRLVPKAQLTAFIAEEVERERTRR